MFIVESYGLAVAFCCVSMLCWGSWANTQKLAAKSWRYELFYWDYAIGTFLLALLGAFTLGSFGTEGRSFLEDVAQANGSGILLLLLAGTIFNISNIMLAASTSIAGMAVAFPLGVGTALVVGVVGNYIVAASEGARTGNIPLLAAGVLLVGAAIVLNGLAAGKRAARGSQAEAKAGGDEASEQAAGSALGKGVLLAILSGIIMSVPSIFTVKAMDTSNFAAPAPGRVTPYTAVVFYTLGIVLSNLIFNTLMMRRPISGEPVSYRDYFKGRLGTHLVGVLGGSIWCLASLLNYISAEKAGPAVSYALGQGAPIIAAVWGVFIWKEFKGSGRGVSRMLAAMFCLFIGGLALIVAAGR